MLDPARWCKHGDSLSEAPCDGRVVGGSLQLTPGAWLGRMKCLMNVVWVMGGPMEGFSSASFLWAPSLEAGMLATRCSVHTSTLQVRSPVQPSSHPPLSFSVMDRVCIMVLSHTHTAAHLEL